ncbi:MAG: general secretion pathway protein C [Betaproteobacteria bacterium HGW-Betaproteobacteria-18]|nr:MAG: general secretion pathway protein C [Betaproteobacteria bacterium HGW-Betaproteobacteria-18]
MTTLDRSIWPARLSTFLLAALAAASVVYWGLRWSEPLGTPRSNSVWSEPRPIDTARIAQLLGASATPTSEGAAAPAVNAAGNYKLEGVIAQGRGSGSALIAIGADKAKPYKVGDRLSDDLVLQSVSARGAALAPGMQAPASIQLELPPLASLKP